MRKRARKAVNRNLKLIIIVAVAAAVALGFMLMLLWGNAEDRSEVNTNQVEKTERQIKREARKEAQHDDHPGVDAIALDLYNARVDDITDPGAVAQLAETMDLKKNVAPYIITLQVKEEPMGMIITFTAKVESTDKDAFDKNVTLYAQQLIALTNGAEKVDWTYILVKDGKEESVTESLTAKQATKALGLEVKKYAESPEMVQTLLNNQKGIR